MTTAVAPTGLTAAEVAERVAGTLAYRATGVGREAYAAKLAEEARRFTLVAVAGAALAGVLWRIRRAGGRRAQRS